jgi:hypothetical protein
MRARDGQSHLCSDDDRSREIGITVARPQEGGMCVQTSRISHLDDDDHTPFELQPDLGSFGKNSSQLFVGSSAESRKLA